MEAPKTAIYGTLYFGFPEQPENLLWMAVYNLSSLNFNKCQVLQSRDVYLFPDLSKDGKAFELWSRKAKELETRLSGARFIVSDLMEKLAPETDKHEGNDLADYLIKQDWRLFRKQQEQTAQEPQPQPVPLPKVERLSKSIASHTEPLPVFSTWPAIFDKPIQPTWDITGLETFFSEVQLPAGEVQLNRCTVITDVPEFVESHFAVVKSNNGIKTFLPYLNRLQDLKQILISN